MWAYKEGEREVGKGLAFFVGWMIIQTIVIVILDGLHLLPGDFLGIEVEYRYYGYLPFDSYTLACCFVGTLYTGIGCVTMRLHEVNSMGWWLRMIFWYLLYLPLSYLFFYSDIGWRVADVWLAPLLWIGEIELVYHIQKKKYLKKQSQARNNQN